VSEAVAESFGLGYAPDGWQNLLDYLESEGIQGALVERAGLAIGRERGEGHYDRFRDRVMFPVIDIWGNTLAFSGRVLTSEAGPKYINSSETKFYTKGKQLYGLHAAKQAIQRAEQAFLVEGNFDVVTLHAKGLQTAIAPMGTAFTEDQARLLSRYTRRVVLLFDGDRAGEEATLKAIAALEAAKLEGVVVRLEPGQDPDSFVREHGVGALEELAKQAKPIIGWALDRVLTVTEQAPVEDKIKALEEAGKVLGQVKNPIVWAHYAEELGRRLGVEPRLYKRYLKGAPSQQEGEGGARVKQAAVRVEEAPAIKLDRTQFVLLVLLLGHPMWIEEFLAESLMNLLQSAELARVIEEAGAYYGEHGRLDAAVLVERWRGHGFSGELARGFAALETDEYPEEHASKMYERTILTLKREWTDRSLLGLRAELGGLDLMRDRERYRACYEQIRELEQFKKELG
jgi:DNA primase